MLNAKNDCRATNLNRAYCRRQAERIRIYPRQALCWRSSYPPCRVSVVEADRRGARLVLPFSVRAGEVINVSFTDSLGRYQTRRALVVWTERLDLVKNVTVGLSFEYSMPGGVPISRVA